MTLLLLSAYTLTVIAAYRRLKTRFPDWQLRAEVGAMVTGLFVWMALAALVVS